MSTKPTIHFRSKGPQGNIFWILGRVQREISMHRLINAYNEMRDRVVQALSYEEALSIIREYVTLIDDNGLV